MSCSAVHRPQNRVFIRPSDLLHRLLFSYLPPTADQHLDSVDMNVTTLCINDESVIPINTRLETWLAGSQQYDTGVNASTSISPRHSRRSRSSIQAQGGEFSDSPNDFNEYNFGPTDERLDLEAASGELGPDDLDDPWPYAFEVRNE